MPTTQVAKLYKAFRVYHVFLLNISGARLRSLEMEVNTPGYTTVLMYLVHIGTYNMPLSHRISVTLMDIGYVHHAGHYIYYYWLQAARNDSHHNIPV